MTGKLNLDDPADLVAESWSALAPATQTLARRWLAAWRPRVSLTRALNTAVEREALDADDDALRYAVTTPQGRRYRVQLLAHGETVYAICSCANGAARGDAQCYHAVAAVVEALAEGRLSLAVKQQPPAKQPSASTAAPPTEPVP